VRFSRARSSVLFFFLAQLIDIFSGFELNLFCYEFVTGGRETFSEQKAKQSDRLLGKSSLLIPPSFA
jgi:hypothetical protein